MNEFSPIRVQRSRQHKQVSINGLPIKYVGRGSRWGNHFRIVYLSGKWMIKTDSNKECADILIKNCKYSYDTKEEAAIDSVKCYKDYLFIGGKAYSIYDFYIAKNLVNDIKKDLKGKNLSCWCKKDETCHADFLLYIANKL